MNDFEKKNRLVQSRIATLLEQILPDSDTALHNAMRYACLNGGKRLRSFLVYATADAYQVDWQVLDALAVAVELIHCYSLVHDDLPCMDDDILRRGKPTCHVAFDEATALLVGDALQSLAFELIATPDNTYLNDHQKVKILYLLAKAIGCKGMVLGQAMDMNATGLPLNQAELTVLHQSKTGALINACIQCAAIACNETNTHKLAALQSFGQSIGLAYQIQDDLLDITGSTQSLGKSIGKDMKDQKNTFVSLLGIEQARQSAQEYITNAITALGTLNQSTNTLGEIAYYCIGRGY